MTNNDILADISIENIRNFAIIAHIDHGKSTLADCFIRICGGLADREMKEQVLDSMDIERERGITIKAQTVRLQYFLDGERYIINLMDTPGHVDFHYEVSRALSACEGSLLVVDASQGVEAQTLANAYKAIEMDHVIIPVLNKIDLPQAEPDRVKAEIEDVVGVDTSESALVSAKNAIGIDDLIRKIIMKIPHPKKTLETNQLQALLIDGWYDVYLGIILLIRVNNGTIKAGDKVRFIATGKVYNVEGVGVFTPKNIAKNSLNAGEIGYLNASIKDLADCKIGDTIVLEGSNIPALPGFKPSLPVVFCSLYPSDQGEYEKLKVALAKLRLNDASIDYQVESSMALGMGFKCGFLGLLHLEIVQERLEREFDLDLTTTSPSVNYQIDLTNAETIEVSSANDFPDPSRIKRLREPFVKATMFFPENYLGAIITLCNDRRGQQISLDYVDSRIVLIYALPLNEIVFDFYDRLKSITSGYASFDWEVYEYRESDMVKLKILINSEEVEEFSAIVHRTRAERRGREMCEKLKEIIPRQMYKVAIQAAIGGKVVAREDLGALSKNVTAKCYGGDVTRKKKLLEKQKKGKLRMRSVGSVNIPKSAFIEVLKSTTNK